MYVCAGRCAMVAVCGRSTRSLAPSMRHLNVQLQPERAPKLDSAQARRIVEALANDHSIVAGYETSEGDDDGPYINFTFLAKDLPRLWDRLKSDVLAHPE